MEYIVVLDPGQKDYCIMEDYNGFVETFQTYEDADAEGEAWKYAGDCKNYAVYARCSDERNHLV